MFERKNMRRRSLLGLAGAIAVPLSGCLESRNFEQTSPGNDDAGDYHTILAPDKLKEGDRFGASVAVSNNTAIVGAPGPEYEDTSRGAAYVFARSDGAWRQQETLTVDEVRRSFGATVDIAGDTAVVLDPADTIDKAPGAVHVFDRTDGSWRHQTALTREDVGDEIQTEQFAASVSLTEGRLAVGTPCDKEVADEGYVHVFEHSDDGWHLDATFVSGDEDAKSFFGNEVELSGDTILVEALGKTRPAGSMGYLYVFERADDVWKRQTILDWTPPERALASFRLWNDTALVGDPVHTRVRSADPPTVDLYERTGGSWDPEGEFESTVPEIGLDQDGKMRHRFGSQLALSDDLIAIVGTWAESGVSGRLGAVFAYSRTDETWAVLTPPGKSGVKGLAGPVACRGETIFVGEQKEYSSDGGAVHVFEGW